MERKRLTVFSLLVKAININLKGVKMKILVVDDMTSMRHVIIHILRSLGYSDIEEATNGKQALLMLKKISFDLLITDFHMPKLNGKQLLEQIRKDKDNNLRNLPVLMVTCESEKESVKAMIACKVTGFVVKPFTTQTLIKQLKLITPKVTSRICKAS